MKYWELRENIIGEYEDRYRPLSEVDHQFHAGFYAALQALSDVMENDDYVNWDDILYTLKGRIEDDVLCEMFNPEDVL